MNPVKSLTKFGQSAYLDAIRRSWLSDGTLQRMIDEDGLRGVTSNPAIFHKAIAQSSDYDAAIRELADAGRDPLSSYEELAIADIQDAADLFGRQYEESNAEHGYVSLEVSPELAHDTAATLAEARRLWQLLARPNVFIKVPATVAGLAAIRELIGEGINVNVTLLFGLQRYQQVVDAYLDGLEVAHRRGLELRRIRSVASFFLSRLDSLLDPRIDALGEAAADLRGVAGVASAKLAYQLYLERFGLDAERFGSLRPAGATPQRLLWASVSSKDARYSDVKYVEPLIGEDTITTLPLETLEAYRRHGEPAARITEGVSEARRQVAELEEFGFDLSEVADQLEAEGVVKFVEPFRQLLSELERALNARTPTA